MNITVNPYEARDIVKEAYLYGWPLSENYNILNAYSLDGNNSEFKAPFNEISNTSRLYGPEDAAVISPNSDTPYSMLWADLRAEPIVITVPQIEDRYFSFQLIDLYTFNFNYIGTRMQDVGGGSFVIVGPSWKGPDPSDSEIKKVFHSETEFIFSITRTQLLNPDDMGNVVDIQEQYRVQTLSQYRGTGAPLAAPPIDWPEPLPLEKGETPAIFSNINFMLQFCPTHPSEERLMDRFAQIGVGAGLPFDPKGLEPDMLKAFENGIADAWEEFAEINAKIGAGEVTSEDLFGTREFLDTYSPDNYLHRFAGAKIGLYGNSKEEAFYPMYYVDDKDVLLNGSDSKYTLKLDLPMPADAFWSVTMYDGETQLLIDNPIDRYLVNSAMATLVKIDDSINIYIQRDKPEDDTEKANWLPTPDGPFYMAMRLYIPKESVLSGEWQAPKAHNAGPVSAS
jgi:hypothetical protein